jgi:signal peptidase II
LSKYRFTAKLQLLVAVFIIIGDQISKILVKNTMHYGESIEILGNFLKLTYIENPGMAFGLRFGGRWFFAVFSLFAAVLLVYIILRTQKSHLSLRISLSLILGGAAGNLIDRFLFGRVVDFVDVDFFDIPSFSIAFFHFGGITRWYVFNIADSAVFVGMFILIYYMLFHQEKEPVQAAKSDGTGENAPEH